jgi:hypothetical protein
VYDEDNYCPICGLTRDKFERARKNFNKHIKCHHDIWRYVYFIIYLETKDRKEYNGLEQKIADLIGENSAKWMPSGTTNFLSNFFCPKEF